MHIDYKPPRTVAKMMVSDAFGRLIAGPVGSGKTTGCMFELLRRSIEQAPAKDGYRYTRFAIVRQTLKQLKDTVRKDVEAWLPQLAKYKVSDSTIYLQMGSMRSEWLLIPLDNPEDQRRLLSMQLTGAWLSEAIEMERELISAIGGRIGRYPYGAMGTPTWAGMLADTNMPIKGSDWHEFMVNPPPDWQIYVQPGGLEPDAENLQWLTQTEATLKLPEDDPVRLAQGRKYYQRLEANNLPDWNLRYVHAKFGNDPSGAAVYRESYKATTDTGAPFHLHPSLEPVPYAPLIIGQDFGRDPWSLICQLDNRGRLRVLMEVKAEDIGLEGHVLRNLRPVLAQPKFLNLPRVIIGDPSGAIKSNYSEITAFDVLTRLGFTAVPAPSNRLDPRLGAVEAFMLAQAAGGPAFMVSERDCPMLVHGLAGGYKYEKTADGRKKATPDKSGNVSHVQDCLQYAAMGASGGMASLIYRRIAGAADLTPERAQAASPAGWT